MQPLEKTLFVLALCVGMVFGDILYYKIYKKEPWKDVLFRGGLKFIIGAILGFIFIQ